MTHRSLGRMRSEDFERMRSKYTYMIESITKPDPLLNLLFTKGVLDTHDIERINNAKRYDDGLEKSRVRKLLDILMIERGGSFQMFLQCLDETGYDYISLEVENGTGSKSEIKVPIIGKTGSGKSLLGNFLMKKNFFRTSGSNTSLTNVCQAGEVQIDETTKVSFIDTPGLFDTKETIAETVSKYIDLFAIGNVDVFLIVVRADVKFTKEERDTLKSIRDIFGSDIKKHSLVVFNNHKTKAKTLDKLTTVKDVEKLDIVRKDRFVLVNHLSEEDEENENEEILEVLDQIRKIVQENDGQQYTNRMYRLTEQKCQESQKNERMLEHENMHLKSETQYLKSEMTRADSLQHEINAMKIKMDELQSTQQENDLSQIREKTRLETQNAVLQSQIVSLQAVQCQKKEKMDAENLRIKNENDLLRSELDKMKILKESDSLKEGQIGVLKERLKIENENNERKLASMREEIERLVSSKAILKNQFENSEKLYIELKEHENRQNIELKQLKQTNDELKVKTQKCEDLKSEEVSKLKMQVLQYEKKLEAITEENSQMLHQNDNLKTQRENLEDRVKELQKKEDIKSQEENGYLEKIRNLEYLRKELKEEKEESEKFKRKNSILQEEIIKINLKYEINLKQMENLKCQLEETYINKTKSDQLNIEQTKLTTDLGVVNRDLSSQNKELKTKLKDAEEMITEIEETKAKITDEKEKLIHECKRLETELKLQNDTYLENSKTHENEKIKLSKEITELKSDCRQGINIIEKYKKKNAGLAEGITKLEKENTRLAESIKLQTTKNEEDAWEISELSNELAELRKQGIELRHKIKLIEDKNEELTKSISENEIDKIQIVDENEKKISELKLSRNGLSSSLEEITHEKEKLTKVVEELLENKQECLNELAKRKTKVEELCCTIEKLKDEAKGLGDRNRELENSNSNLKSEYELQTHKCSELENNVRTMEGNYKHSVNETEKLLNEIKVETSQKTLLGILMKNSEFLKREEIKGLRKELARYKTLSCVKTREAERLKRNYKNLEQMKCDLESMVQKNQEHYERINSKHGEIMDENTNIRIELVTIEEKMEIIRTRMGIFAKRCDEGTGATQSIKREAKEPTLLENISKDETCESFHKKPNVTAPSCTVVAPRIQVQCKMKSQHACVVEPGTKGQLEKEDLIPLSADTICDKTDQIEWENEKPEDSFKEFHQSAEEIERMIAKTKSKSDDNYTRFNSLNIGEGIKYSDTLVSRLISKKIKEPKAKYNIKKGNDSKNKKSPGSSQLPKLNAKVIPEKKSSMNIFLKLIICLTVLLFFFLFQYFPKEIVFVGITVLLYNILSGIMYIMKSPKIFRTMHVRLYESEKPDSDESTALPVVQKATTTSQTQIEKLAKSSLVDNPTTLTEAETEELTTLHKSVNPVLESSNGKSLEDEHLTTTPQAEKSNLTETETTTICEMREHTVIEAETLMALPEDKNAISPPQIEKSTGEKATTNETEKKTHPETEKSTAGPISEESSVDNPTTLTEAETKELTTLRESDKPSLPTDASKLRVVESSKAKSLEDEKPTTPPAEDTSLTEAETKKLTTLHESVKPALPTDNSKLPVLESSSTESLQDGKPTTPRGPAETTTLPRTEKITTQIPSTLHDAKKEVTLDQAEKTTSHGAEKLCEMREHGVVEAETLVTLPEDENAISPPQIEKSATSSDVEKPIKCHDPLAALPPEGEEAVTRQETEKTIALSETDTSSTLPQDQNVTSTARSGIRTPVQNEASESLSTADESGMITREKATTNETERKTTHPETEKSTAGPISEESSVDNPTILTEAETKELTTLRESDKPSLPTDASKLPVVESSKAKSLEDENPTTPSAEDTTLTEYGTKKLTTPQESNKPALPTNNSKKQYLNHLALNHSNMESQQHQGAPRKQQPCQELKKITTQIPSTLHDTKKEETLDQAEKTTSHETEKLCEMRERGVVEAETLVTLPEDENAISPPQIEKSAISSDVEKPIKCHDSGAAVPPEGEEAVTQQETITLSKTDTSSTLPEDQNVTSPAQTGIQTPPTHQDIKTQVHNEASESPSKADESGMITGEKATTNETEEKKTQPEAEKSTAGPISEESSVDKPTTLTEAETKELTTLRESDKPSLPTDASKLRVVESSKAKSLEDEKPETRPPVENTSLTEYGTKKLITLHESVKPALPTDNSKLPVLESSSTESLQDGKPTTPRGPAETTTLPRTEKITTQIPSTLHDAKKEVTLDQAEKTTSHEAEKLCEMREHGVVEAETLVTLPEDENAISPPQIEKSATSSDVEKPIKCHDPLAAVPPEGEEAVTRQETEKTIALSETDTSSTLPQDQNVTSPARSGIRTPVQNEASESLSTADESGMITREKATTNETERKTTHPETEKSTAGPISEESSVDNPTTLTEAETKELTTLRESDKPSLPTDASKLPVVESSKAKSLEDENPTTPSAEDTTLTEYGTKKLTTPQESNKPALHTNNSKKQYLNHLALNHSNMESQQHQGAPRKQQPCQELKKITTQIPSTLHDTKKEETLDQAEKTTSHETEKLCEMRERGVVEAETLVTLPEDENAISPPQIEKSAITSDVEKPIKCHDSGAAVPPEGEEAVTQQETITLSKTDTSSTLPEDQNVTSPAQTGIQAPPTHQDIKTQVHNEASESPSKANESGMITGEKATTNETEEKKTQPEAEKSTAGPISEESSVDKPTTLTEAETKELTTLRESDKPSLPTDASKLRVVESSKAKSLEDEKPETRPPVENSSLTEYGTKKLTTLHESVKPALPTDNSKLPVLESSSTESLQDGKPTTPRGPAETTTLPRTEK